MTSNRKIRELELSRDKINVNCIANVKFRLLTDFSIPDFFPTLEFHDLHVDDANQGDYRLSFLNPYFFNKSQSVQFSRPYMVSLNLLFLF